MNIKANYDKKLKADRLSKPKLRTYVKFKDDCKAKCLLLLKQVDLRSFSYFHKWVPSSVN